MTDRSPAAPNGNGSDLDHTSFAVHDAMNWSRRLRRELGATPIGGEVLAEFRYLLLYVGNPDQGATLELLDPVGTGFLTRYLAKRGEGPHHITFNVPDLRAAVERARALRSTMVGESYEHAPWREAFIMPDPQHSVVIQLAQSDRSYPSAEELLGTRVRDPDSSPSVSGAVDPWCWTPLWETPAGPSARLGRTHLASTDLVFSRRLFEGVLDADVRVGDDNLDFSWPSGTVRVHASDRPGMTGMNLLDDHAGDVRIGPALLGIPE